MFYVHWVETDDLKIFNSNFVLPYVYWVENDYLKTTAHPIVVQLTYDQRLYSNIFMAGCAGTHLELGGSEKTERRRNTESSIIGQFSDLKSELLLCNENM